MAIQVYRFPKSISKPRELADVSSTDLSLVISALMEEQKQRPALVERLSVFPQILGEYLLLDEHGKQRMNSFSYSNSNYFSGGGTGDSIHYFSDYGDRKAELLARKCRCASQLFDIFNFYLEHGNGKKFNTNYIVNNKALRRKHSTLGLQLYKAVYQNNMTLSEIVDIVADVRPEITVYYCAPEEQYVRRARVIELFADSQRK